VLHASWTKLSQELPNAVDLDSVIAAHDEYVLLRARGLSSAISGIMAWRGAASVFPW
jgi:hypothetical protein